MPDRHFITELVIIRKHPREPRNLPPDADGLVLDRDTISTARVTLTKPGWEVIASPFAETIEHEGESQEAQVYWMGGPDL